MYCDSLTHKIQGVCVCVTTRLESRARHHQLTPQHSSLNKSLVTAGMEVDLHNTTHLHHSRSVWLLSWNISLLLGRDGHSVCYEIESTSWALDGCRNESWNDSEQVFHEPSGKLSEKWTSTDTAGCSLTSHTGSMQAADTHFTSSCWILNTSGARSLSQEKIHSVQEWKANTAELFEVIT